MPRLTCTLNFRRLLLMGGCIIGLLFAPATVLATDQKHLRPPLASITIENFENGETVRYDLPLLTGTAQGTSDLIIYVNGATTQWSVNDGRWRAFVSLREGTNHLTLMTKWGGYLSFYLEYLPLANDKTIRLVYLLGSDSAGNFDAPPGVSNALVDAIPRIQLAGRMIQSLTAELFADKGLPRQTFRLLTGADKAPIVETQISPLSVNELRSMDGLQLWFHFVGLMRDIPNRENIIDFAIIADTHFDPSINPTIPLAHTALGAFPLALFGGGSIHSWPTTVDKIESRYTDSRPTEPFLFPEFGRSNQYWSNATTSVGAAMHELGHTFGLGHPDPGDAANLMNRGFDYLNRAIVTFEPGLGAIDPASDLMPRWDDSSIAILRDNPWFAAAPPAPATANVFVTSTPYNGDLGGLAGADNKCQSHADAAGLGGSWIAWLSTSTVNAIDRFPDTANGPFIRTGDAAVIAVTKADLTDGSLLAPISNTETGDRDGGNVWTGTRPDGTRAHAMCDDWSSVSPALGVTGGTGAFDSYWTEATDRSCSDEYQLYCFNISEVPDTQSIQIDIKPKNDKNVISLRSSKIEVAILGSENFDALQTKLWTVRFGPNGAKPIRGQKRVRDINRDGFMDLILRFKTRKTGIQCGDTEADLSGKTYLGTQFTGTDSITTVGCKPKKPHCEQHHDDDCDDGHGDDHNHNHNHNHDEN